MTTVVTFLAPLWLVLGLFCALAWLLMPLPIQRDDGWRRAVDAPLLAVMQALARMHGNGARGSGRSLSLLLAALLCLGLAAPALQRAGADAYRNLSGLVLAVDLSPSMLATDGDPTRLTQAQAALRSLLRATAGEQVALIGFAGDAYVLAPFNADTEANLALVEVLAPEIMPEGGSRPAAALRLAATLFADQGMLRRRLVLISDGAGIDGDTFAAATMLRADGVGLDVVGVGSVAGAPPRDRPAPLLCADRAALTRLAGAAGGTVQWLSGDGSTVALSSGVPSSSPVTGLTGLFNDVPLSWQSQAHWLALLLLPLALLLFRRQR